MRLIATIRRRDKQFGGVRSDAGTGARLGARHTERYFAAAAAYFLRNLSTRPAVSTIFCLPV